MARRFFCALAVVLVGLGARVEAAQPFARRIVSPKSSIGELIAKRRPGLARLLRIAGRYRQHPDVDKVAAQLASSKMVSIQEPFRLHATVKEHGDTLTLNVLTVASPNNRIGPRWFPIYRLGKNRGDGADPTLAKAVAAILRAVELRHAQSPGLRRVEIAAPSVANTELGAMLREQGFTVKKGGALRAWREGQLVIGKSELLTLELDLPSGP